LTTDENKKNARQILRSYVSKYISSTVNFSINIEKEKTAYFAEKIEFAIENDLPIVIHGDYDVDGIISTLFKKLMIEDYAKHLGKEIEVSFVIPDRSSHYGISYPVFNTYLEDYGLVITSDNGTHREFFEKLNDKDHENLLIVDHHPNGCFKEFVNVIDPNIDGSVKISTGMVDEFLFQSLRKRNKEYGESRPQDNFMDLSAITLISDMADTNNKAVRSIIKAGLKKINERDRAMYSFLWPEFNGAKSKTITLEDISFLLIPILNSPGRIGIDANWLIDLMKDTDGGREFSVLARKSIYVNNARKSASNVFNGIAQGIAEEQLKKGEDNLLSIQIDDCPVGLNGLIAGTVFQKYMVDTIVVSRNIKGDNLLVGSGRGKAIKAHLLKLVEDFPEISPSLIFGGHNAAIGLRLLDPTVFNENLEKYNKNPVEFKDLKNERKYVQDTSVSIDEYREMCDEYANITSQVPLGDRFHVKVKARIVGVNNYRNNFKKLILSDGNNNLTVISKENKNIDYESMKDEVLGMAIKPLTREETNDVMFTDMVSEKDVTIKHKKTTDENINTDTLLIKK